MIVLILFALLAIAFMVGGLMGPPWVPTRTKDIDELLDDARLAPGQSFIELGCGDGRLLAAARRRGAQATGYEINPVMWLVATVRNLRYYPRVRVRLGNFWRRDLSGADVVMAFLVPRFMRRLEMKAKAEIKPGARLVSYIYALPAERPKHRGRHWFVYQYK